MNRQVSDQRIERINRRVMNQPTVGQSKGLDLF